MQDNHRPFHQKYRPKNLDELIGQKFISITLKQALLTKKIAPAYLFNGPRGTGKTSSARILAKSLNCLSFDEPTANPCEKCELCKQINEGIALDIIEIDAASNTGVENMREIIERARFSPSQARWKVYVIDECHMLSTAASNALLKTIEEPPSQVVFILATTNPERVLTTIQSRCQKFEFKRISINEIYQHLYQIASKESINFQNQALKLIAKRSNGGMRDAQSLLDQVSLFPDGITTKNVQNLLGEVSENDLINLINALINNHSDSLLISCNKLYDSGNEPSQIIVGLLNITRDLLLNSLENEYSELYYTSEEFKGELDKFSKNLDKSRIIDWHSKLKNIEYQIKTSDNPRLWLEINLTSLLEKENIKTSTNYEIAQTISNQDNPDTSNNQKSIDKVNIIENTKNKVNSENSDDEKLSFKNKISDDMLNKNDQSDLKNKWELILSKLELPSTRMLLSQQAELESLNSTSIVIALSPNWESMIKSRKVIIENAVKKIYGDQIKIIFSCKKLNNVNSNIVKDNLDQGQPIKKLETKNTFPPKESSKKESFDNSPKNLANFFNGEIIDFDE